MHQILPKRIGKLFESEPPVSCEYPKVLSLENPKTKNRVLTFPFWKEGGMGFLIRNFAWNFR